MILTQLELANFRSYAEVSLAFPPGVTVLCGRNGQGKTNLVEAIDYLATLGSHRVASEAPLVRQGADDAVVRGRVQAGADDPRSLLLEIQISPGRRNRARLNRGDVARPRDLLGILRTVLFAPDDLAIVKGEPAVRRRFIDDLLVSRWPRMAAVQADYARILKQRNSLLKSFGSRSLTPAAEDSLAVWDVHLTQVGAELWAARRDTLVDLAGHLGEAYAAIAPASRPALALYRASSPGDGDVAALADALAGALVERRREEVARGLTLVGPHRDDVDCALGDLPAKGYASHGESWSFALALRLASFALLRADGIEPVLILDDVFAELDAERRRHLAQRAVEAEQVFVTAAVADDVPPELAGEYRDVHDGEVSDAR